LNKDADYQKALKLFEYDLLQQKLLIALITEAQDEKNLKKNYAELTEKVKGKKDFRVSYIALKTQNEANSLYKSLSKFPSSFAAQAKKKSRLDTPLNKMKKKCSLKHSNFQGRPRI
jgi:parvulin-like peptidyl-prolyl isomerase